MAQLKNWIETLPRQGQELALALLDLVAPKRCMGCLIEGSWMCTSCQQRELNASSLYPQRCIVCGQEAARGKPCFECREATSLYGCISAGPYYSVPLRRGIHWLKFKGVTGVAESLACLLVPPLLLVAPFPVLQDEAVIIPMPLSKRRLRERGFNQSVEIARYLSDMTHIPIASSLSRTRATHAQAQLPHELRKLNVEDAFVVTSNVPDKKYILLLDDVATTGSTLSAAAHALQQSSAAQLWGLTVARG